jgi:hypothetical protein
MEEDRLTVNRNIKWLSLPLETAERQWKWEIPAGMGFLELGENLRELPKWP